MRCLFLSLPFATTLINAGHYDETPHKIKESIEGPPRGWLRHSPAPANHLLELKIALPQPHFPILEQHLWEISNPKHSRYGAYLSKEEAEALMAPHPESFDVVNEWLSSYGIEEEHLRRSPAQDWVTIRVPVALAEKMLNTIYDVYIHSDSSERIVRTTSYSLPEDVHQHVELIQPTTMFARLKPLKSTLYWQSMVSSMSQSPSIDMLAGPAGNPVDPSCNGTITITCLRQLYNAVGYNTSATNGNKVAVAAYLGQYANNKDLQQFFQLEDPAAYGFNYTFVSINGGLNNQSYEAAGDEANLDTQIVYGLTHPTPAMFYSVGGSPPYSPDALYPANNNEPYAEWLDYMFSHEYLPQTISTSFADNEQTVPYSYATRVCDGFAALGARGVSLLFGSGDDGVGDGDPNLATQKCFDNSNGPNRTTFLPAFPASCPYVTSVGATKYIPEVATNFSGGGFSNYFPRPAYQDAAVSKYLGNIPPKTYQDLYNPNGRGIPDVAAQGQDFLIIYRGQQVRIGGTSASTPTFASFVSMLNDARLSVGKRPLGFLNPWLYETGLTTLNDITVGNNPGCGTQGFNATIGWDPVTGLGTPDFEKLMSSALAA